MQDTIISIIRDITNKTVTHNESLVESGLLDSMGIVDLVMGLTEEFQIDIDLEDLTPQKLETVEQIEVLIKAKL